MAQFEVGKWYWNSAGFGILVAGRTDKTIKVKDEQDNEYRLKIHEDCGNEWAYDSRVSAKWRDEVTFLAAKGE